MSRAKSNSNYKEFDARIVFKDVQIGWGGQRECMIFEGGSSKEYVMLLEDFAKCVELGYLVPSKDLILKGYFGWYRRKFIIPKPMSQEC